MVTFRSLSLLQVLPMSTRFSKASAVAAGSHACMVSAELMLSMAPELSTSRCNTSDVQQQQHGCCTAEGEAVAVTTTAVQMQLSNTKRQIWI